MIFYRQIGEHGNGGYRIKRSFFRWISVPIWRFRLSQALKLTAMSRQPDVISALHGALREQTPLYLSDWRATMEEVGGAVDDLYDVMEWLRESKDYKKADRVRVIMSRLAKSVPSHQIRRNKAGEIYLIRDIARNYK